MIEVEGSRYCIDPAGGIADALGLSVSAVHAYLRTARRKLECASIEQAIAKAIRVDLIQ